MSLYVDTSVWYAAANSADASNSRAKRILDTGERLVTTDHVSRLSDGSRRVVSVSEIVGMEKDVVAMQELFRFHKTGIDEDGRVVGRYEATGIRPKFADRLFVDGIDLEPEMFFESSIS